jgi:hypothetical protein
MMMVESSPTQPRRDCVWKEREWGIGWVGGGCQVEWLKESEYSQDPSFGEFFQIGRKRCSNRISVAQYIYEHIIEPDKYNTAFIVLGPRAVIDCCGHRNTRPASGGSPFSPDSYSLLSLCMMHVFSLESKVELVQRREEETALVLAQFSGSN